ncbi:3-deoxy-manno-octulosonate cytidylyltransferase [bacterium]|nr:3-deoxy-manno-octulosonate cytidylyltransferase [bacterium]
MTNVIIIPARLKSTRLPNKVILDICGKSMIQRVFEQAQKSKKTDEVFITTDSETVVKICEKFTSNIILTDENCQSGTDRLARAVQKIDCKVVINVQGDEPLIDPILIDRLAETFEGEKNQISSAMCKINKIQDLKDPNTVKVVVDKNNFALYFSRSAIPFPRDFVFEETIFQKLTFWKHIGLYGYTKEFLLKFALLKQTQLERVEKLEQLRALENGFKIKMIETEGNFFSVDTKRDLEKVRKMIGKDA